MSLIRGQIRKATRSEAVARAYAMISAIPVPPAGSPKDAGGRPINYRLETANGGKDPYAPHCADWSYGGRTPTSDCIGFVLWASGIDRCQPSYSGTRGEWLNCASLLDDAHGAKVYCRPLAAGEHAEPGDWLVTRDHIGIIVRPECTGSDHLVVDCSPRHGRSSAINTGLPWSEACEVIRYTRYI